MMDDRRNNNVVPNSNKNSPNVARNRNAGLPDPNAPVTRPMANVGDNSPTTPVQQSQHRVPVRPSQQIRENPEGMGQNAPQPEKPKKKGKKGLFIGLGVVGVLIVGVLGMKMAKDKEPEVVETVQMATTTPYELTGRYALDKYLESLKTYDAMALKEKSPDSWVAKEWKYANSDEIRQNWIKSVCAYVEFGYPESQALDTNGNIYVDEVGNTVTVQSDMTNGEPITVTVIDFEKLGVTMLEDKEQIIEAYEASGYAPEDYTYRDEMVNLMLDYLLTKANYPTTTAEIHMGIKDSATYFAEQPTDATDTESTESVSYDTYIVVDDSELDNLLFSSDAFHNMCDSYASLIAEYEYEIAKKEYEKLVAERKAEQERLEALATATDENGETLAVPTEEPTVEVTESVETQSMEDDFAMLTGGGTTAETEETVEYTTTNTEVETPTTESTTAPLEPLPTLEEMFPKESIIHYTWVGAWYCRNVYDGDSNVEPQIGDGSFELPAGIGTTVITKALCDDGNFHDVKITLMNYCVGKEAIAYAQRYSEKNRGWDENSLTQLICYEIKVENLENTPITLESQMFLSDEYGNKSSRTGSVFGFKESISLQPYEVGYINDWATSTELAYKYVCWGSEFKREFPVVWFRLLAGSGDELDEFDATKSYVNRSDDESDNADE